MPPDNELDFLRWLEETDTGSPSVDVPIGDDAAVVRWGATRVVVAADAVAEGAHFLHDDDPRLVGRKALAINLSDLAAMGAEPVCAVASAALPKGFDLARAKSMTAGMREIGAEYNCPLVGGDTVTHHGGAVVSVTALGRLMSSEPVRRTGAEPGYVVMMTGMIGGSSKGRHLTFPPRIREARRLVALTSRLAMIDISDGLLLDLSRITKGMGFRLDASRIPVSEDADDLESAMEEGEDFELLFAVHPEDAPAVQQQWGLDTRLTHIGEVTDTGYVLVVDGEKRTVEPRGFSHG